MSLAAAMVSNKQSMPDNSGTAVLVEGVRKTFGSRLVLRDVDLQVPVGSGVCVCGANASGKTTLLRVIAGLLQPEAGRVEICGFAMRGQSHRARLSVGAIFHANMVYPQLTVRENMQFFARLYAVEKSRARIEQLLAETHLLAYRYDKAGLLSRGMAQRLAIARALIHSPAVLLADEPFTGLDAEGRRLLTTMMSDFKAAGGSIVMTTHHVPPSAPCCEQVTVLRAGKLLPVEQHRQSEIESPAIRAGNRDRKSR